MLKSTRMIYLLVIVLAPFGVDTCYAVIETEKIAVNIPCPKEYNGKSGASKLVFDGIPNVTFSLETSGIEVREEGGEKKLVTTDWYSYLINIRHDFPERAKFDSVQVVARCIGSDMQYPMSMWPPPNTLHCKQGEGIFIQMMLPKDPGQKYSYIGILTATREIQETKSKIEATIVSELGKGSSKLPTVAEPLSPASATSDASYNCLLQ